MALNKVALLAACAIALSINLTGQAYAQIAYGVNAAGNLFRFNVATPGNVTVIGPVQSGGTAFLPEGIDFRPSTSTLFAIDVGPNTTQLYTIDLSTAAATAVGAGFTSSGVVPAAYNLTGNQTFGFDFNPTTLQADGSIRIRLVGTNGVNLRLNSDTGAIAAVDGNLIIQPGGASPFVDAVAYGNNFASMGGTTTLYDMDSRNNKLYDQTPANSGQLNEIGPFGVTIDAQRNIGFDIYSTPNFDFGLAVFTRPDAPTGGTTPIGSYLLYDVNLATGATTNGRVVGPAATPFDFEGGFAVLIPEPTTLVGLLAIGSILALRRDLI
mgnify:CR=1 FL=1